MIARRVGWALLVVLALAAVLGRPVADHGRAVELPADVDRVVVLAVPELRWEDVDPERTPALWALLEASGVALLSPQTASARPAADDVYATLGAGARVVGSQRAVALAPDEPVGLQRADEAYQASTGLAAADAALVVPGIGSLRSANRGLPYQGEPGALAEVLAAAHRPAVVVAAGDVVGSDGVVRPRRDAFLALVDHEGRLALGATGDDVLVEDPASPFGLRYDRARVLAEVDAAWAGSSVVLVEASMTGRAAAEAHQLAPAQAAASRRRALGEADGLVGDVVALADEGTAVVVLGTATGHEELALVGVRAPGVGSGLLRSASTRRAGHLLLVDLAPTVLALLGEDRPPSMEGRTAEVLVEAGSLATRRAALRDVEEAAVFRDSIIGPVAALWIVVQLAVLALSLVAWSARPRLRGPVLVAALALLVYVPVTFAAVALPLHRAGLAAYVGLTGAVALVLALLVRRLAATPVTALLATLGSVVGILAVDLVLGAPLQLNAVFGYTPTVAGRFAGIGNLAFALLAPAALLLAALWTWQRDRAGAPLLAAGLLALVVLVDGLPVWGSDVGGVLALVPAAGLLLVLLGGRHVRPWTWVLFGVTAVVILGSFLAADLARPEADRTHLARLAESVDDTGIDAFVAVGRRKLQANLDVLTGSALVLLVPIGLAVAGWTFWRGPGPYGVLARRVPTLRPALASFFLVAVLGFAVNDSGIAVPAVAYGILNASLAALVVTVGVGTADDEVDRTLEPQPALLASRP